VLVSQSSCSGSSLAFFDFRQQRLGVDSLSNCSDIFGDCWEPLRSSSTLGTGPASRWLAAFFRDRGAADFLGARVGVF
jgi:hypothetical protein